MPRSSERTPATASSSGERRATEGGDATQAFMSFQVVSFDRRFRRDGFRCGVDALDQYLRSGLGQDAARHIAHGFLLIDTGERIAGFYTLAAASVMLQDLPVAWLRRVPKYRSIPAAIIGRFALDSAFQGLGLGEVMLVDALERVVRSDLAAWLVLVEAKDIRVVRFYQKYGFLALHDQEPLRLFLPTASVRALTAR
ncbi:hypothetical protein CAL25_21900 [Bordetella genomosp. 5]|uniref:N-acetyltransferase domain-containing protein n=2 Tax=Bordetella genomosp. 5 TaxID=1395608 RepID=A0A261T8E6_9BORD|nr:hypothetical protein CAL25_21900 [Bordetella genomosp. 5]